MIDAQELLDEEVQDPEDENQSSETAFKNKIAIVQERRDWIKDLKGRTTSATEKDWCDYMLAKTDEELLEEDESCFKERNPRDGAEEQGPNDRNQSSEQGQDTRGNNNEQPNNNTSVGTGLNRGQPGNVKNELSPSGKEGNGLKQATFDNDDKPLVPFPGSAADGKVKTVGWLGGRGARYINMYGSKSAPRYRIEEYCYPPRYEDEKHTTYQKQNISYRENRYGESMENGKYKYTGRNMLGIFGVAWTPNSPDELETIDPQRKKESNAKWNTTYVLVKWKIDGKEIKSWETRTCIRRLWKRKEIADQAIYDAALEAENRYRIENGLGRFSSRSPSVGLIHDTVEQRRAESLNPVSPAQERVEAASQTANPTPANASIARLLAMPQASGELISMFNQFLNFMQSAQASTPAALPM
ncbi:hypothetical protein MCOR02_012119 [Pyricularia oryzae]|nr:hypothetical protein MCOR02_012119 [Pyricularia oryzae]KAI6475888.1 hypothetical protein MCOR13_011861 [Pyricularia oryzae]